MAEDSLVAGVELGGTKCVVLIASGPDDIRAEARIDTTTPDETLAAIAARLAEMQAVHGFSAIGVGSFGPIDLDERSSDYGRVVNTPKPGWSGADLLAPLRRFGVPIGFDTDVNGAAFAEGLWGAAQDLRSFAYVTVGTGVGVGAIIDGRPVRGLGHAELGHLRVPRLAGQTLAGQTFAGVCPYHGDCVEGLAAGPAIQARAGRPADRLAPDDPAWDEAVHALAACFHNLVLTAASERILVGGGVGQGQPHLLPRIRRALVESLNGYAVAPRIAADIERFLDHPALGGRAGPLGSIALAHQALAHQALAPTRPA